MSAKRQITPTVVDRPAQAYVGQRRSVTMQTINEIADRIPAIMGWLATRGLTAAAAPFLRYHVIDMDKELQVEAGVPVETPLADAVDDDLVADVLPAGRYATVTHRGHPDQLVGVNAALLAWIDSQGLRTDMFHADDGDHWTCRLEVFNTNPAEQPDPNDWETVLAIKLAD